MRISPSKTLAACVLALLCLYPLCAATEELTEPDPTPVHDLPGMLKRYGVAACLTRKMQEAGADPRSMDMARAAQGAYHFLGWGEYGVYPVEAYMEVEAFVDEAQCGARPLHRKDHGQPAGSPSSHGRHALCRSPACAGHSFESAGA